MCFKLLGYKSYGLDKFFICLSKAIESASTHNLKKTEYVINEDDVIEALEGIGVKHPVGVLVKCKKVVDRCGYWC